MLSSRASGILLHPTSLPSRFGIGELGREARQFVDFLAQSKQQFWQVLPLGPTGYGNSPYMCYSAIAGNPLLISLEVLHERGLLSDEQLSNYPDFNPDQVEFDRVILTQYPLYHHAWNKFQEISLKTQPDLQAATDHYQRELRDYKDQQAKLNSLTESHVIDVPLTPPIAPIIHSWMDFEEFCESKSHWLDDYALFMALKQFHDGKCWTEWELDIAWRNPDANACPRESEFYGSGRRLVDWPPPPPCGEFRLPALGPARCFRRASEWSA